MIHFKNKRVDLLVTPNHTMIVKNTRGSLKIEEAGITAKRAAFTMPQGVWKGIDADSIIVPGIGEKSLNDVLYLIGLFIGDGITAYQEKRSPSKTGLARSEYLKAAKIGSLGRFASIEHSGVMHQTVMKSYRVFLYIPKKDPARRRVEQVLTDLGLNWSAHGDVTLYFSSEPFMRLLDECGKYAENKHIPRWCLEYNPSRLRHLFNGLMDSDGHTGKIPCYVTVSERLAANFCELVLKIGLVPYIHTNPPSTSFIKGRRVVCRRSFHIAIGRTRKGLVRKRIRSVDYDGVIWCATVKDNHNLLVERNGRIDFCGNSSEVYGDPTFACGKIPTPESYWGHASFTGERACYDESKRFSETLCAIYHQKFGVPVKVVRPFNVYGPGARLDDGRVIPNLVKTILEHGIFTIYGNGSDTRSYCYVSDAATQVLSVLLSGQDGEAYNVGDAMEIDLNELGRLGQGICGGLIVEYVNATEERKDAPRRRRPDVNKILKIAPMPIYDLKKGLERTIKSYR